MYANRPQKTGVKCANDCGKIMADFELHHSECCFTCIQKMKAMERHLQPGQSIVRVKELNTGDKFLNLSHAECEVLYIDETLLHYASTKTNSVRGTFYKNSNQKIILCQRSMPTNATIAMS